MKQKDNCSPIGEIDMIINWKDGRVEKRHFTNSVLRTGRQALASSLANDYGDTYDFYISRMLFGDGGTSGGSPKYVNTDRNGLFGTTQANKTLSSTIDLNYPYQVVFSSVLTYEDANGVAVNEIGLQMNDGDLYSMATFGDISKTSSMQITWNWRISLI